MKIVKKEKVKLNANVDRNKNYPFFHTSQPHETLQNVVTIVNVFLEPDEIVLSCLYVRRMVLFSLLADI